MIIRRAVPSDVDSLRRIHNASIRRLCSAHYTPEQIHDWIRAIKPEGYLKAMEAYEFMLAVETYIEGFCILNTEKAEVTALYVAPQSARKGIGRTLIREAELLAGENGLCELNLKATLNAVEFYERVGFLRREALSFLLPSGTGLMCISMTKSLDIG